MMSHFALKYRLGVRPQRFYHCPLGNWASHRKRRMSEDHEQRFRCWPVSFTSRSREYDSDETQPP